MPMGRGPGPRPGRRLLRTTAIVGGTAAVAHHAGKKSANAQSAEQSQDQAIADLQAQQAQAQPAAAPAPQESEVDQLQKLANLHEQGLLTDAEFTAEKHRIIGV